MIKKYVSSKVDQRSPVQPDFKRVVNIDDEGNEFITYEEIDYPKYQKSLGSVADWSLESLLKAGIDPGFPIHTGYNTRLEGVDDVNSMIDEIDAMLKDENKG